MNSFRDFQSNYKFTAGNSSVKNKLESSSEFDFIKKPKKKAMKPPVQECIGLVIYHIEDNKCINSKINKAIMLQNELIRLASKSNSLNQTQQNSIKEDQKLLKKAGLQVPKMTDLSNYLKSKECISVLRDKAILILA